MAKIGMLQARAFDDLTVLTGFVRTSEIDIQITIEGDPTQCDDRHPSHRISMRASNGRMIDAGAAWLKTAKTGPSPGNLFFSLQLDYPELQTPLNVAAFKDAGSNDWSIVWRRRAQRPAT